MSENPVSKIDRHQLPVISQNIGLLRYVLSLFNEELDNGTLGFKNAETCLSVLKHSI